MKKTLILISAILLTSCQPKTQTSKTIITPCYPDYYIVSSILNEIKTNILQYDNCNFNNTDVDTIFSKEKNLTFLSNYYGLTNKENSILEQKEKNTLNKEYNVFESAYFLKDRNLFIKDKEINNSYNNFWLNPNMMVNYSFYLKNNFIPLLFNSTETIEKNYKELQTKLTALDAEYYATISKTRFQNILLLEDFYSPLESYSKSITYNYKQIEKFPNKEEVLQKIVTNKDSLIVLSNGETATQEITTLEQKYGFKVLVINNFTNLSDDEKKSNENYITLMLKNLELIKNY